MCGMTREEDIRTACAAGVDAIGLVFYPPSPRSVALDTASKLAKAVSLFVDKVVLFVNPTKAFVDEVIAATRPDVLQFHGDETPEFCQQFGIRYIKAIRVKSADQLARDIQEHQQADAILLDAFVEGVPGGTGEAFDWQLIPESIQFKVMLAGGLTPDNVFSAVTQTRPFAVDVSGGIEQQKGIKSAQRILDFAAAVRAADAHLNEISS